MTTDEKIDRILAIVEGIAAAKAKPPIVGATPPKQVADAADLDGKFGDPEIRKDPPLWIKDGGASFQGKRYSDCPPDYLDKLAGFFDWQAGKDEEQGKTYTDKKTGEEKPSAPLKRRDAARARGWAERKRAGWKAPAAAFGDAAATDDIPF